LETSGRIVLIAALILFFLTVIFIVGHVRRLTSYDRAQRLSGHEGIAGERLRAMRNHLRERHGVFRSRRAVVFLVAGSDASIDSHWPALRASGWHAFELGVLVHVSGDDAGQTWAHALRRYHPADAVVWFDGPPGESGVTTADLARVAWRADRRPPVFRLQQLAEAQAGAYGWPAMGFLWTGEPDDGTEHQLLKVLGAALAEEGISRVNDMRKAKNLLCASQALVEVSPAFARGEAGRLFIPGIGAFADTPVERVSRLLPSFDFIASVARRPWAERVYAVPRWRMVAGCAVIVPLILTVGFIASYHHERAQMRDAAALGSVAARDAEAGTRALRTLQQRLTALEASSRDQGWLSFGLDRSHAVAEHMSRSYDPLATHWLVAPVHHHLTSRLARAPRVEDLATYLWLAHPDKAEAATLAEAMLATGMPRRPAGSATTPGEWHDRLRQLYAFHAERIAGPADAGRPPIVADDALVARARKILSDALVGPYAADAIHVRMLEGEGEALPPVTLDALTGGRAAGLLVEGHPLPGMFTRQAWEERIRPAIDAAVKAAAAADGWVLNPREGEGVQPTEALRRALRERYVEAFAEAWRDFLNDLRWQEAPTLDGVAGQLAALSHPSRSPLPALFATIAREASTAAPLPAVPVPGVPAAVTAMVGDGPLAAFFAPLTAHAPMGEANADAPLMQHMRRLADVHASLQSLLLEDDPGDASRLASRSMRRGAVSSLGEGRALAASLAAGLGQEWLGFGDAVFRKPVEAAARAGLTPIAPSVNAEWQATIASDWQRDLADRYPFVASEHDASMAALSRLLHPEHGALGKFVATRLDGVIERQGDRWRAVPGASRVAPPLDPAFIDALDRLTRLSNLLFVTDGGLRFALRASPVEGVEEMTVQLPGGHWRYFNQRETWTSLAWPMRDGASALRMAWRPPGGALQHTFAAEGPFAILRWLEQAEVEARDGPVFRLRFAPADAVLPALRLQLRGEDGDGPMALLALRGLALPDRVFLEGEGAP
jgi:type VI secretion system protein ImpL